MDKKICRTCLLSKPLDDFYTHSKMADGHLNKCKSCVRSRVEKHRLLNLEKVRKYDRVRGRTPKRLELNKKASKKYRAEKRLYGLRWLERNPEKRAAHIILGNAIRDGRAFKLPCEVCGNVKSEAHHDDYTKPLQVKWLCRKHHAEIHRKYKEV